MAIQWVPQKDSGINGNEESGTSKKHNINIFMEKLKVVDDVKFKIVENCEQCGHEFKKEEKRYSRLGDNIFKCKKCYFCQD